MHKRAGSALAAMLLALVVSLLLCVILIHTQPSQTGSTRISYANNMPLGAAGALAISCLVAMGVLIWFLSPRALLTGIIVSLMFCGISFAASCNSANLACGCTADSPNTVYNVTGPQTSTVTCINVTADNVTISCAGNSLTGNNATGTYGVYTSNFNTTITYCIISNFSSGINFSSASNGTIAGTNVSTTYNSGYGIYLVSGSGNAITNSIANSSSGYGIYVLDSNYNSITNSKESSGSNSGIYFFGSNNSNIIDSNGTIYLYASSYDTIINCTGKGASTYAGIVLDSSSNNTIINATGTSSSTYAGIALLSSVNNSITNSTGTYSGGGGGFHEYYGISLQSSSGNAITNSVGTGGGVGYGISLESSSNNTITNSVGTTGYEPGIYLQSSSGNTFINSTGSTSGGYYAVLLYQNSNYNTFINSTAITVSTDALDLHSASNYNTFINFNATTYGGPGALGIRVSGCSSNNFTNSYAKSAPFYAFYIDPGSSYNRIANMTMDGGFSMAFGSGTDCTNSLTNITGGSGKPILYYNNQNGVVLNGNDTEQIVFCGVNYSTIFNAKGTSVYAPGIYLQSSSNNNITNSTGNSSWYHGIYFYWGSNNNTLTNCTGTTASSGSSSNDGIYFYSGSDYNTLVNCTGIAVSGIGIDLYSCSNNNLTNCNGTSASGNGIELYASCNNNILTNCTATSGQVGFGNGGDAMVMWGGFGNTVVNLIATTPGGNNGIYLHGSANNTFTNCTANTSSGYVARGIAGIGLDGGAVYNNFTNCTATITSGAGFGSGSGFALSQSSNYNTFTNCTGNSDGGLGAYVDSSSYNIFTNDTLSGDFGFYADCTNNLTNITAGTGRKILYYNNQNGVILNGIHPEQVMLCNASSSTISNTNATSTNGIAIYVQSSSNDTFISSNGTTNTYYGIYLQSSSGNAFANSTGNCQAPSDANAGIYLSSSSNNAFANSSGNCNSGFGINLDTSSNNNNFTSSSGTSNSRYGIYVLSSSGNTFANSTAISNSNYGILLSSASGNTFASSTAASNLTHGIVLASSSGNIFVNFTGISNATSNGYAGIDLSGSSGNNFTNSTGASSSGSGIQLNYDATNNNNNFINSTGASSSGYGIVIYGGSGNNLNSSTGASISNYGIVIYSSPGIDNIINSTGTSSSSYGICLASSSGINLINSTGASSSSYGIVLSSSNSNNLINSTGTSSSGYGIVLSSSNSNNLNSSTGTSASSSGVFLYLSSNNMVSNTTMNGGFGFYGDCSNTLNNNSGGTGKPILYYNNQNGVVLNGNDTEQIIFCNASSSTISNSNATTTNSIAIDIYNSPNDNITSSTATSRLSFGICLYQSNNGNLTGDNASGRYGFELNNSNSTQLSNNAAFNSSNIGLLIFNSNQIVVQGMHFSNNSPDMEVLDNSGSPMVSNFSSLIFDNPLGNMQNYTNLSINTTLGNNTQSYSVNWSGAPATPPFGYEPFAQEFVSISITPGSNPLSINSIVWSWTDTGSSGHNESTFGLWKYSSGWVLLNGTPDTTADILGLRNMNPASVYGILEIPTSIPCQVISAPGTYVLPSSVSGVGVYPYGPNGYGWTACILINSTSNVVFDCAGHTVNSTGSGSQPTQVAIQNSTNVAVRNCILNLSNVSIGLAVYNSSNSMIRNNSAYGSSAQVPYEFDDDATAINSSFINNSASGTTGFTYADGTFATYANNTAANLTGDVFNFGGRNSTVTGNTIINCSNPFAINGNRSNFTSNLVVNSGSGFDLEGSWDRVIGNNVTNSSGIGFNVQGGDYNTLQNNIVNNDSQEGFLVFDAVSNNLSNNLAYNDTDGFDVESDGLSMTALNNLTNNLAANNSGNGFYVEFGLNNTFFSNNATGNGYGFYISDSNGTILSGTYFHKNSYDFIVNNTIGLSSSNYSMVNSIFDNPLGGMQNYTNLSINDSVNSGESYTINWTCNSSSLPAGKASFAQTFANISVQGGTVSIDSIAWSWTNPEASGYNQSRFQLWKYSGTWTMLNNTPDIVFDTLGYTNLNPASIYGILQDNDTTPPAVNLIAPLSGTISNVSSVTFSFNTTDDASTTMNCSMYIDGILNQTNTSVQNGTTTVFPLVSGIPDGFYRWNVTCTDQSNNLGVSAARNFTVDTTVPSVTLNSPYNLSLLNSSSVSFNFTATDNLAQKMSCLLFLDNVPNQTNSSVNNNTATVFNVSGISDGNHTWYVNCTDNAGNANTSETRSFNSSSVLPNIALNSPANGASYTSSTPITVNLIFTATDAMSPTMNCSLYLDGLLNYTNASVVSGSPDQISVLTALGSYAWNVTCRDIFNNTNSSATYGFTISSGGGGGGGGGGGSGGGGGGYGGGGGGGGGIESPIIPTGNVTLEHPVPQKNACALDADCSGSEACLGGTCKPMNGTCGFAANHTWHSYECCADADCPVANICVAHKCEVLDLTGDNEGLVGGQGTVTVTLDGQPLPDASLQIMLPDGASFNTVTNADGQFLLPLDFQGNYTVKLMLAGVSVKMHPIAVGLSPPATQVSRPAVVQQPLNYYWALPIIVIMILAYLAYRKLRGGNKKD